MPLASPTLPLPSAAPAVSRRHPDRPSYCAASPRAASPLPLPLPLPQDQLPADPDARKSWQWSKAKKWAMHIASRVFSR